MELPRLSLLPSLSNSRFSLLAQLFRPLLHSRSQLKYSVNLLRQDKALQIRLPRKLRNQCRTFQRIFSLFYPTPKMPLLRVSTSPRLPLNKVRSPIRSPSSVDHKIRAPLEDSASPQTHLLVADLAASLLPASSLLATQRPPARLHNSWLPRTCVAKFRRQQHRECRLQHLSSHKAKITRTRASKLLALASLLAKLNVLTPKVTSGQQVSAVTMDPRTVRFLQSCLKA